MTARLGYLLQALSPPEDSMTAVSRIAVTQLAERSRGFLAAALLVVVTSTPTLAQSSVNPDRLVQRSIGGALEMLEARDVSGLTAEQRAKRAWMIAELRKYQAAESFPANRDFAGDNVPYFVDPVTGVVCALGNLMVASGHRELVDRIAAQDNNVWVLELAADAEVGAWLDEHGITLGEAARIQVPYVGDGPGVTAAPPPNQVRPMVAPALALATAGLIFNSFVAPGLESASRSQLGIFAGVLAIGIGTQSIRHDDTQRLGRASLAVGAASLLASTNVYLRFRRNERIRLSPIIPTRRDEGTGLSLTLTF